MTHSVRNFFRVPTLHTGKRLPMTWTTAAPFLALRSLSPMWATAIPRRFSSSSLPPSFVSGRFAGFSLSGHPAHTALAAGV